MPSNAVALRSEKSLTPAMMAAVWEIAAALNEARVPAQVPNSVWLEVPTARLCGPGAQSGAQEDNAWLRECLERLTSVKVSGEHRGHPWGAVVLAEWHVGQEGSLAHLLITPAGVQVLRSPATFTRIEAQAARKLTGHRRRLYALLADKKDLGRPSWRFGVEELRALMGADGQTSYDRFNTFRQRVVDPAVAAVNAHGTVSVTMTPERLGRSVRWVRFDWRWKDPHEAAEMAGEGERQGEPPAKAPAEPEASPKPEAQPVAPPEPQANPVDPAMADPAMAWWTGLTDAERDAWGNRAGPVSRVGSRMKIRSKEEVARAAYVLLQAKQEAARAKQEAAAAKQEAAKEKPKPLRTPARRRAAVKPIAEEAAERERTGHPALDTTIRPPADMPDAVERRRASRTTRPKPS